jgi:hypothetical protein
MPCGPLSYSGAYTPVRATVSFPWARLSVDAPPVCCATARRLDDGGSPTVPVPDQEFWDHKNTCGSELARERGGSGRYNRSGTLHSRAGAFLHRLAVIENYRYDQNTCGSELARECGGSGRYNRSDTCIRGQAALLHRLGVINNFGTAKYLWE